MKVATVLCALVVASVLVTAAPTKETTKTTHYGDRTVTVHTVESTVEDNGKSVKKTVTRVETTPHAVKKFTKQNSTLDLSNAKPKPNANYAVLAKNDPGVAKLFEEFDQNRDRYWQTQECKNAITAMVHKKYLPTNTEIEAECVKMAQEGKGVITLSEFVAFAKRTAAHAPSADNSGAHGAGISTNRAGPKTCAMVFSLYDKNSDGGLDREEFGKAMKDKVSKDALAEVWHSSPHKGQNNSIDFETFKPLCMSVTGLPGTAKVASTACASNPCTEAGSVCVPEPKVCFALPCPQFRCVAKKEAEAKAGKPTPSRLGKCIRLFHAFDANHDMSLTKTEFLHAIAKRRVQGQVAWQFNSKRMWFNMDKTTDHTVGPREFVHFCIAVFHTKEEDSQLISECWDVHNAFDADQDLKLDEDEFVNGMRNARRIGHLPVRFPVRRCWATLKKNGDLSIDRFVTFCKRLSRGFGAASCHVAATPTVKPLPKPTDDDKKNSTKDSTKNSTSTNKSSTPSNTSAAIDPACKVLFGQADGDKNGKVNLREFKASCPSVSTVFRCNAQAVALYAQYTGTKSSALKEGTAERAVADVAGTMTLDMFNKVCVAERQYHLGKKQDGSKEPPPLDGKCSLLFQQADVNANKLLNAEEFRTRCVHFSTTDRCAQQSWEMFANATGQTGQLTKGSKARDAANAKDTMTRRQFESVCLRERPFHEQQQATLVKKAATTPNPECDKLFSYGDTNNDNRLSIDEWRALCRAVSTDARCNNHVAMFAKYTEDGKKPSSSVPTPLNQKTAAVNPPTLMTRKQFRVVCVAEGAYKNKKV